MSEAMPIRRIRMKPVHPGHFLRDEVVDASNLSLSEAAELLGINYENFSEFLSGKTALTPDIANNFENVFGISSELLMRMQKFYELGSFEKDL